MCVAGAHASSNVLLGGGVGRRKGTETTFSEHVSSSTNASHIPFQVAAGANEMHRFHKSYSAQCSSKMRVIAFLETLKYFT